MQGVSERNHLSGCRFDRGQFWSDELLMMICVWVCVWEYVLGTMWSGRSALWDRCPHLVLNYSSCQLACPPSLWKPLTKSFTPPSLRIHLFISASALTSSTLSLSLPHYLFPGRSFTASLALTPTFSLPYFSNLFICLSSTPIIQYICLPH